MLCLSGLVIFVSPCFQQGTFMIDFTFFFVQVHQVDVPHCMFICNGGWYRSLFNMENGEWV